MFWRKAVPENLLLEYSLCLHSALEQTLYTSHYISPLKYTGVGYTAFAYTQQEQTLYTSHYISPLKYKGVGYNNSQQAAMYWAAIVTYSYLTLKVYVVS